MDLVVELPPQGVRGGTAASGHAPCRYRALTKIGGGSFGDILAAVNEADPEDWLALKIEARYRAPDLERQRAEPSMVRFERLVCRELERGTGPGGPSGRGRSCPCPLVRGCLSLHGEQDVLAMELLGPNLREYATLLGKWPLPQDMVLLLGAAVVGRLRQLHACGFVHRDLKPENLLLRLERAQDEGSVPCLVLVDYAMAMRYARPGGRDHIPRRDTAEVAGTHRYMAIHAQRGVTQSRRSDLESLGHVLLYLALGHLPWRQHEKDFNEVLQCKERLSVGAICQGLRPAFERFLQGCRELEFDQEPDYSFLQRVLLEGVAQPVDFEVARIRCAFKRELQEAYLQRMAAIHDMAVAFAPQDGQPSGGLPSMLPIFARHNPNTDTTELTAYQPSCATDLDIWELCFFFEGYREPLPGTLHIVVGSCHFFGFLTHDSLVSAHAEAGLSSDALEQILVLSFGKRDWVVRAATLQDYDPSSGRLYKEWNLRYTFWARVTLPWGGAA